MLKSRSHAVLRGRPRRTSWRPRATVKLDVMRMAVLAVPRVTSSWATLWAKSVGYITR